MTIIDGRLVEFQTSVRGMRRAIIQIETEIEWEAGTYFQVIDNTPIESSIPVTLYRGGLESQTLSNLLYIAPPFPDYWQLGTRVKLRGPLGTGFKVPLSARKIGLLAWGTSSEKLLPLIPLVLKQKAEVVLLADTPTDNMPTEVEIGPLSQSKEILDWADFIAMDMGPTYSATIIKKPGFDPTSFSVGEIQALFSQNMPCGGMAKCGVCQFQQAQGKNFQLCEDGPVLRLKPDGSFGKIKV